MSWHEETVENINTRANAASAKYTMQVTRFVALEGLGLLKLAEKLGYSLPEDIALIPSSARLNPSLNQLNSVDFIE